MLPRKAKELSPLQVRRLVAPGRWCVGGVDGLALQVSAAGARSWVLRLSIGGRQREMGLGSFPTVTLADARDKARAHRAAVANGTDPIAARSAARSHLEAQRLGQRNFAAVAADYIDQHAKSWKNVRHRGQWTSTLRTYAEPVIGDLLVSDIGTVHVIRILEPIWASKTETATRLRSRIELILDFAAARGLREGPNPARWRGNLEAALPSPRKLGKIRHHAALPLAEMQAFMVNLRSLAGIGARAVEFAILTAARSGEVRGASWPEFELKNAVWTIPASRMKSGREHRVPLADSAIALLSRLQPDSPEGLVFPGRRGPLSDMSLTAVLRRMQVDVTVHGFRSTFRDWCAERTDFPGEVAEMALAHTVADKVEAAYRRGDLFDKRRRMMTEWARFLAGGR